MSKNMSENMSENIKVAEKPALLLLPNLLSDYKYAEVFLPPSVAKAVSSIDGLIAESEKEGRRYLSRFQTKKRAIDVPLTLFNEHTKDSDIDFILEPIVKGERWGLVSDAGLPCIADPGSKLVLRAMQRGIHTQAFSGPSSLLLSLMLSGLPGQKFFFQGYLDKSSEKRKKEIRQLEQQSKQEGATQVFIEAPYRNEHLLQTLLETLSDETWLSIAWDLTLPNQGVLTRPLSQWKKSSLPNLNDKPAVFLLYARSLML